MRGKHSSCVMVLAFLLLLACGSSPEGPAGGEASPFLDTFSFSDDAEPTFWLRTGGTGDGQYAVMDSTYAHTSGQHCSYYRWDSDNLELGAGTYEFDVYGPYWEFAWRISTESSTSGTCHRVGNYQDIFGGYFIMLGAEWSGPDYSWQSSSWGDEHEYTCPEPEGFHHVIIEDTSDSIRVCVDTLEIFSFTVDPIPAGTIGIGCGNTWGTSGSPWFDNLGFSSDSI
jgi:hypothetical protein